jgi:hypothetical protein
MKTLFKLYEEERCFGNQSLHASIEKKYIMENTNMKKVIAYIELHGDQTKSYSILKYVEDDIRWRQLIRWYYHKNKNFDHCEKSDISTTWARLFYNTADHKWKETNYRYEDEKVV